MPTWVSCRPEPRGEGRLGPAPQPQRAARHAGGFTLLEMLFAMLLIGLLAGIAVPGLVRLAGAAEDALRTDRFLADLSAIGYRAHVLGQSVELRAETASRLLRDGDPVLPLPPGWRIQTPAPIHYAFNGYCGGGVLTVETGRGPAARVVLAPPYCRASREDLSR